VLKLITAVESFIAQSHCMLNYKCEQDTTTVLIMTLLIVALLIMTILIVLNIGDIADN
jgi:hypothetical protein